MLPGRTLIAGYFRIEIIEVDSIPEGGVEGANGVGALVGAVGREGGAGVGVVAVGEELEDLDGGFGVHGGIMAF